MHRNDSKISYTLKVKSVGADIDGQTLIIFEDGQEFERIYALTSNLPPGVKKGGVISFYTDGTAVYDD